MSTFWGGGEGEEGSDCSFLYLARTVGRSQHDK